MSEQNRTDYAPTATELKLLETLLDPNNRLKSVTDVCQIVGCSRTTYYEAFNKPEFVALYTRQAKALSQRHLAQVMNTFVREATRGSFQHGKAILEMANDARSALTLESVNRLIEQLGLEVINAAQEAIGDDATRTAFLEAVDRRWASLTV